MCYAFDGHTCLTCAFVSGQPNVVARETHLRCECFERGDSVIVEDKGLPICPVPALSNREIVGTR